MTEPSAKASLPTPITVQLWCTFSAPTKSPADRLKARIQTHAVATALNLKGLLFMVLSSAMLENSIKFERKISKRLSETSGHWLMLPDNQKARRGHLSARALSRFLLTYSHPSHPVSICLRRASTPAGVFSSQFGPLGLTSLYSSREMGVISVAIVRFLMKGSCCGRSLPSLQPSSPPPFPSDSRAESIKLTFVTERPSLTHLAYQEVLIAAEASIEYSSSFSL
jgi:hypothetical protein